jgi:hypothetical protein
MDYMYALCRYIRRGYAVNPEVLNESHYGAHVLICDGLCLLYKGYSGIVIKHGHLCN